MKARIFLVAAAAAALVCFTVAGVFAAEVRGVTDKEVVLGLNLARLILMDEEETA